ncbi:hypothetical protein Salat_1417600 [Sesamum alatum]|uniref:Uncharacterized protein n=1 Tax=Sesamum alatum TaxID=300844 RepID=A0AAE1YA28_9LAMI|nr:hypothetical protein Salat_1417600 [Sesamum alatum]
MICTSVSLRASTRVSPGFALLRHSSPFFGSRQHRERKVAEASQRRALSVTIGATTFHGHIDCLGFGRCINPRWSPPRVECRISSPCPTPDRGALSAPIRAAFPNKPTCLHASWRDRVRARWGSHPLQRPFPGNLGLVRH